MQLRADDVPVLLRRAGVVGAGGAGFPTYIKYQRPTPTLIANCTESEPGYFADKLLLRDHTDVLVGALRLLRDACNFDRIVVAVKEKHAHYAQHLTSAADETGLFEMSYVPDQYVMGEEKTLTKFVTGTAVPRGAIPPHVGVTVQNTETLFNIYWALTEHRGVTDKFVQLLGELGHQEVLQTPVGTPVATVASYAGHDPQTAFESLRLVDGGPLLGDVVADPSRHVVQKTTNGLLWVPPEHLKGRGKRYPQAADVPPDSITPLHDQVMEVAVPLATGHCVASLPVVNVGQTVVWGQEIAHFRGEQPSVSCHASIPGVITAITDQAIHIRRPDIVDEAR